MRLSNFEYSLDPTLIAQSPIPIREDARLLVFHRESGKVEHRIFSNIVDYLTPKDLLVLNDSKVFPARLYGTKGLNGNRVECLLMEEITSGYWKAMIKGRSCIGELIDFGLGITGRVVEECENGYRKIQFSDPNKVAALISEKGCIPLPPYIKRDSQEEDKERYQTVYASSIGSVAAPTAGLHFSSDLLTKIQKRGIPMASVTLHIGPGTFRPIRSEIIEDHQMDEEKFIISKEVLRDLKGTKESGGRIIGVGTSSTRVVESLPDILPYQNLYQRTSLFIIPGFSFRWLNGLVTNFHLPKSTPYLLASAFAGIDALRELYQEAIRCKYRFYSYGDAMLIL